MSPRETREGLKAAVTRPRTGPLQQMNLDQQAGVESIWRDCEAVPPKRGVPRSQQLVSTGPPPMPFTEKQPKPNR